jgi:hypothetical protein
MTELEPDNLDDGPDEQEPDENTLPSKPEEPVPSDEEVEAEDEPGDDEVPDEEFLDPEKAAEQDDVDDEEFDSG